MLRICFLLYITCISLLIIGYLCDNAFIQERAKLKYANPKYIKDVVVFTGRKSRHDPYLTNISATVLVPFGNNITGRIMLSMSSGGDFKIVSRFCDSFKSKWMVEYTQRFTNISLSHCPIQPARYMYMNMELPPKNIPIPIADGDNWMSLALYITATKEPVLDTAARLRFDKNKVNSKKDGKKAPKKG